MRRICLLLACIAGMASGETVSITKPGEKLANAIARSNCKVVGPTDNIQLSYTQLVSAGDMGNLSENNQRQLVFSPGTYTMSYTVLMDTDYVNCVELVPGTVTITKSGNGMGIVKLPGIKATVFMSDDDRLYKGVFSRPSVSYDWQSSYAVNELWGESVPVCGFATNVTESATEIGGSAAASIQFATNDYLFTFSSSTVYKFDGASWTSAGACPTSPSLLFDADGTGNCVYISNEATPAVYYGTFSAGTITFTRAKVSTVATPASTDFSVRTNAMEKWNFIRLSSGTLLLSEYSASPIKSRYIYRSTDKGHNWTEVFDAGADAINHYHGFGQLLSTDRIIAQSGDGSLTTTFYSDDDGLTWHTLIAPGTALLQPIDFIDIGHPTKLLCADDTVEGLYLLDCYSGEKTVIFRNQDRRTAVRGYFWDFEIHDGVVYVGTFDNTTDAVGTSPVIYASDDLVNWAPIYRISCPTPRAAYTVMWFKGQLHSRVSAAGATQLWHLSLTPPSVGSHYGIRVEQAIANQYSTTDTSSFEGTGAITQVSGISSTVTRVSVGDTGIDSVPHGTQCAKVYRTGATISDCLISKVGSARGMTVVTGQKYCGSFMLGVPSDSPASVSFDCYYIKSDGVYGTITGATSCLATNGAWANGYPIKATLRPGEWKLIEMTPILVDALDVNVLGLYVKPSVNSGTTISFLVDCVQMCEAGKQPSSWQVGGTPRAASKYDVSWQTSEKATHAFVFCPLEKAECYNLIGGDWYIRSWRVSATVYGQLYYDADDQKFKLYATDGTNNDTLETDARYFKKGQPITFVVQFGDDGDTNLHLHVGDGGLVSGGTIKTVDGAAEDYSAFNLTNLIVRWGDKDGANGLNGTLYDLDMTGQLAASQIVDYVNDLIND